MRILVRHDQPRRDASCGVSAELRCLHLRDELARRARDFPGEFRGEKDRGLGDAEIGRPDLGLVYRPDEGGVFFLREVGIKAGALGLFHRAAAWHNQAPTTKRRAGRLQDVIASTAARFEAPRGAEYLRNNLQF